jgi:hypothetical protein
VILSLMLLMAMQQQVQSPCDVQTCTFTALEAPQFTEIVIENHEGYCDKPITFGKTKKKIADLFPEECLKSAVDNDPIQIPAPQFPFSTGRVAIPLPGTDATTSPAFRNINTDVDNWKPEPVDVPAIQEERIIPEGERPTCKPMTCPTAKNCFVNSVCLPPDEKETVWTCADKTRILMHDEQNPPKYWCHAPHQ